MFYTHVFRRFTHTRCVTTKVHKSSEFKPYDINVKMKKKKNSPYTRTYTPTPTCMTNDHGIRIETKRTFP